MEPRCLVRLRMAICLGLRSEPGQLSATASSLWTLKHVSWMLFAWQKQAVRSNTAGQSLECLLVTYAKRGGGLTLAEGSLSMLMGSASGFCLPSVLSILGSLGALVSFGAASRRGGGGKSSSIGTAALLPFSLSSGGGPLHDQEP